MQHILNGVQLREVAQDMARNIVSLRKSEDLFDDLSDDPDERAIAAGFEMKTKPPVYYSAQPIIDRPFEEAEWFSAIGYPFKHWQASRYSTGQYGVWYGAPTIEATVYETVHHWRNGLLADAEGFQQLGVKAERKVYHVSCQGALIDLRPVVPSNPALVHPNDYALTQQLGKRLQNEGHPGLLTVSARCEEEVCAIFNPLLLSNPRVACFLTYTLTEDGVLVERETGKCWLHIP